MSARQFVNSLSIIRRTEHTHRGVALARHLYWQGRKLLFPRPVQLALSRSIISDDEPGGVISLVNMLGAYDFNNMHLVQMVLGAGPPAAFADVGANIGAYTLIASEIPFARVVSLEPIPAAFAKLQHNVALNGRKNVTALNVGASKQPGHLLMTCDGASSVNRVVDAAAGEPTLAVEVDTLDAICGRLGVVPSIVKIDVEGHEPEVLAGAGEVLSNCMACLVENGNRATVVDVMRARGLFGPFYYQHRRRTLERTPQGVPEDQVFVTAGFRTRFPGILIVDDEAGDRRP